MAAAQLAEEYDWAGEMPGDGGVYGRKNDTWFCQLCWKFADESEKPLKNI